jgi:hypothetical protein
MAMQFIAHSVETIAKNTQWPLLFSLDKSGTVLLAMG